MFGFWKCKTAVTRWDVSRGRSGSPVRCSHRISPLALGLISRWRPWQADKDHKPQTDPPGAGRLTVCVRVRMLGSAPCTHRPAPHLAASQSRLPLWPSEQLSPLGEGSFQSGGGGRLTCPLARGPVWARWGRCAHVCVRGCVGVSVWCLLAPSGLQIMVECAHGELPHAGEVVGEACAKSQRPDE